MNTNTIAESFCPINDLDGKFNFQRFILVNKDGTIVKRVVLIISDMLLREEIICGHFLSRYVQLFLKEPVGVKYKSRDNPWDFYIELSNGEKQIIEITAIADQINLFKSFKSQERLLDKSLEETVTLRELIKLNKLFPDPRIQEAIKEYEDQNTPKSTMVNNPHYNKQFIFQSELNENFVKFGELLKEAINKKLDKNHANKEEVTLIIDNRTVSYSLEDVLNQLGELDDYFERLPFKEVWMYTGYYSDFDGNNAEYSLAPLKISQEKLETLNKNVEIKTAPNNQE